MKLSLSFSVDVLMPSTTEKLATMNIVHKAMPQLVERALGPNLKRGSPRIGYARKMGTSRIYRFAGRRRHQLNCAIDTPSLEKLITLLRNHISRGSVFGFPASQSRKRDEELSV